jgi:transposase
MYVGVDVHKNVCRAAIVDEEGEVADEFMFKNSSQGIEDFAVKLKAFREKVLVAVE